MQLIRTQHIKNYVEALWGKKERNDLHSKEATLGLRLEVLIGFTWSCREQQIHENVLQSVNCSVKLICSVWRAKRLA